MSREWYWKSGEWYIICDVCGHKIRANESRERWDGFRVCKDDWETRHPMDFLKSRTDKITPAFIRPQPTDTFVEVTYSDTGNTTIPEGNNHGDL